MQWLIGNEIKICSFFGTNDFFHYLHTYTYLCISILNIRDKNIVSKNKNKLSLYDQVNYLFKRGFLAPPPPKLNFFEVDFFGK